MDLLKQMNELQNQLNYFEGKLAILKNIADRDVFQRDSQGDTQLHLVLQHLQADVKVIKELLDMGASVKATNNLGQSPLHYALRYKNCDLSIVRLLVDRGADVQLVDHWGLLPLFHAVENKNCSIEIIEFLVQKGANLQIIDNSGFSLLHHALMHKHSSFNVIKLLLDKGVDVNTVNKYGESALHIAVKFNRKDAVKVLLKKPKIKINLADKTRYTPLHWALGSIDSNDPGIVKLLLEAGANVEKKTSLGQQSLHLAAFKSDPAIIKLLLDYEARINVLDNKNWTPLLIAVKHCKEINMVAIKSLLDAGALIFSDHPMRKFYPRMDCPLDEFSPLHFAVNRYDREKSEKTLQLVQLLLKYTLLERPRLCFQSFHVKCCTRHKMLDFDDDCMRELQSVCIKPNVTLAQFILQLRLQEDEECKTSDILDILAADVYPLYKEVVSGLLTRNELKNGFRHHLMYAIINGRKRNRNPKRVVLDYDSICIVMKYLFDEDLLNLLLALHDSNKSNASRIDILASNNTSIDEIELESERYFKRARIN